MKKCEYKIVGLDCANCANEIQEELNKNPEIKNATVSFAKQKLSYETETMSKEKIEEIVKSVEPEVEIVDYKENIKDLKNEENQKENRKKFRNHILRLAIGVIIALVGIYAPLGQNIKTALIICAYAVLLYRTAVNAVKLLFKSKTINENLLITVSCIGAYLVGKQTEGLMVITLYEIGKILEEKAINKTRKSISDLMDIKPEYANIKENGEIKKVSPDEVNIGDTVVVKQGEKIPLDGKIVKGKASLNTASLTGESKPQDVKEQDNVLSGSIVLEGILEIKVTEKYENSTVSKILELVENATDKKAKTETFVNKAAKIYTPIVLGIALLVAVFLPLISNVPYTSENGSIYRALIFLVISCPCAIAISIPLCYFSGIGKSSKEGILIKGSDYLDGIKNIKEVIFDKTGTLTKGEFTIEKVEIYDNMQKEEILEYAILGESYSNHPIAKSIIRDVKKKEHKKIINSDSIEEFLKENKPKVSNNQEIAGKGISYEVNGKTVLVGNSLLVGKEDEKADSTKIYVKINNTVEGAIILTDEIKPGTKEAIQGLHQKGIVTKMFTGDNKEIAEKIAKELEIDEVNSQMLPEDKYKKLEEELKNKQENSKVAYVGDGINDSPVLARADIGISMGGIGAGSSIEASDVVIMTDDINKINTAIDISKRTHKIVKQNLTFSVGIKIIVLILSVLGVANMWEAVFADVGATLITVLNSIRILK